MNILDYSKKFEYNVETTLDGKNIHQIVSTKSIFEDKMQQVYSNVYNTANEQFKEALIKLGWKPPEE